MSFRDRMNVVVSAAEWEIRERLALEGIHMEYQKLYILDAHNVDICGQLSSGVEHVFEINGPVHRTSEKTKRRDEFLENWFSRHKINYWPLDYEIPLPQWRREEIIEFIKSKGFGKAKLT